jgi:hypothetical protein
MPNWVISETNPNEDIGGGGCVCSETKCEDCKGPYVVCYATEMANNLSPHTVISLNCAREWLAAAEDKTAVLASGQGDTVESTAEPVDEDDIEL